MHYYWLAMNDHRDIGMQAGLNPVVVTDNIQMGKYLVYICMMVIFSHVTSDVL